ncbi:PPE domain-containing protein [Mycobacterium timonense]|uniref:PPE domain-containing protein n=1 Tax=Mycobacterium bouchedurhonense TaxID=701041 RepID=A0AAW5S3K6_MYCBC|nr:MULTISPECIES: PPE domain-containing protein [Mycobacterium avium complex (MAC)]MCV6989747.1 PPE domain-containing protein [Mycobacterium bouchedurhonense]MCV6996687.1 PPE domain-containing protein [Mycobacterium timonense]ORA43628.1 hypothetical protein BST19_22765 [Mycobacterium bouchedurhonense]
MAELRVDPAEVGPRLAAAFSAAAAALAAPAGIAPAPPAGSDPVSVAAANRAAVNSAKLSGHLAGGIKRLADGAQAVTTALNGYVVTDEAGAAEINGGTAGAAAGAAIGAINLPSPPAVDIPNVPVDIPAALASVPADPATVDEALTTGAGAGGLEGHAAAWDGVATQLRTIGAEFRTLGSSLPASWAGPAGESLSQRLLGFGDWMHASGEAASSHASNVRQLGGFHRDAVSAHPRAVQVRQTEQALLNAAARAAAGDPAAAAKAAEEEAKLSQLKEQSVMTMARYGQGAAGVKDVEHPGDSPRIGGDGDPHLPNKPAHGLGSIHDPQDVEEAGDAPAEELGETTGKSMQDVMGSMTTVPSQVANAVGQALSKSGQSLGQLGQQASQAASQLGQGLGGGSPLSGLGKPASGNPLSRLGSGSDLLGSGAGGGSGAGAGGTMPAGLPEQLSPGTPAAPPPPTTAPTSIPRAPSTSGGGMGGMPMGMMPMGRAGGDSDKELTRNPEWFPDEPLVKDEPEVSEAVAGQRRRPRPTET